MNYKIQLDKIFSEYIRRRDSNTQGIGRCISCKRFIHWKDADAGHYVNRRHMSLRYDEKNVNLQCRHCNRFYEGNMIGYYNGLVDKYGKDVIMYLEIKKSNTCKLTKSDYEALIKHYKKKLTEA